MKKTNIIIFIVIVLIIAAIACYAIWGSSLNENKEGNVEPTVVSNEINENNEKNENSNQVETNTVEQNGQNQINTNETNTQTSQNNSNNNYYIGDWFISEKAYRNAEEIDHILDMREDNLIADEEFESKMASDINVEVAELDVDRCTENQIRFDFTLTSPAPTQREADLDNLVVDLDRGAGTFTYTDNWGNSGNGTIILKENQIELRLETTSAAQGAQWGVEGVYTFSYKRID